MGVNSWFLGLGLLLHRVLVFGLGVGRVVFDVLVMVVVGFRVVVGWWVVWLLPVRLPWLKSLPVSNNEATLLTFPIFKSKPICVLSGGLVFLSGGSWNFWSISGATVRVVWNSGSVCVTHGGFSQLTDGFS